MFDGELKAIKKAGFDVRELTPYQFRINHVIDLYPRRRKFHNIRSQERGFYPSDLKTLLEFLKKEIVPEVKPPEEPKELWKPWWAKIGGGIRTEPEER